MKKSNNCSRSKIGVFDKNPISCHVDTSILGEVEGCGYHRF